jgi:hypothetical protein
MEVTELSSSQRRPVVEGGELVTTRGYSELLNSNGFTPRSAAQFGHGATT